MTDILLPSDVSPWSRHHHERQVSQIERRLHSFETKNLGGPSEGSSKAATIDQLYQLATLIYLNRSALQYSGEEIHHARLVDEALSKLLRVKVWEVPWPFFIIGCEAQTDSQRRQVLESSATLQAENPSDNATRVQKIVEAFWNQADLGTAQGLSYVDKMSAVITACPFLPIFA